MAAECAAQHAAARYMDWHPQRSCRGTPASFRLPFRSPPACHGGCTTAATAATPRVLHAAHTTALTRRSPTLAVAPSVVDLRGDGRPVDAVSGRADATAVAQPTSQGQRGEELAAALNTSLEDLERARADVSGAVEKAREQEQLRSASEANADRCVRMPLRPAPRSRMR